MFISLETSLKHCSILATTTLLFGAYVMIGEHDIRCLLPSNALCFGGLFSRFHSVLGASAYGYQQPAHQNKAVALCVRRQHKARQGETMQTACNNECDESIERDDARPREISLNTNSQVPLCRKLLA
jgi:hypothetical protein